MDELMLSALTARSGVFVDKLAVTLSMRPLRHGSSAHSALFKDKKMSFLSSTACLAAQGYIDVGPYALLVSTHWTCELQATKTLPGRGVGSGRLELDS
eukprot:359175-Chlamydomonas_euryale.AAC.3